MLFLRTNDFLSWSKHDVYNNRKDKGIHRAIQQAKRYMNATHKGYYLQLDIKGFFYSLDKNILFMKIFHDISNAKMPLMKKEILWLSNKIIYHDPTRNYIFKGDKSKLALLPSHKTLFKIPKSKGLPIGNLTSQFFANVYMNDFDNFIKRKLKVKYYIRYVDDFVLFDTSKERLQVLYGEIENYLNHMLKLELRADTKLKKHTDGLDFLGYIIRENYILTRQRVVKNYKKTNYLQAYENQKGKMTLEEIKKFLSVQASFVAHIKHSNSFNLMSKVGKINESNPFDFDRDE
ncbi:MAG: Retron-type reverse transcriptase [uncultured Sulfurovum sp.]|uniref:Retron-type reverse transcriptase n=1 Tax=uncultured Sulfurovum sp. TaxID=269237 RepID=A0A6S6TC93_9BACT|nr:MAG: Retron-type reverse transcriptase [uncultured Sulfurovum sp.]